MELSSLSQQTVLEPSRHVPVLCEVDVCVIGGSATGVFAAVRAARMGKSVAIVERLNCFGGNATAGMVCAWHSLLDVDFERQIIGGLSVEVLERLKARNALHERTRGELATSRMMRISQYVFNVEELKTELDEIVLEHDIKPYLHTLFADAYLEDGALKGIFVQNKSGRGVILAKAFVDATGDGDLCVSLGEASHTAKMLQPAATCALVYGYSDVKNANELLYRYRGEYGIPNIGWDTFVPGTSGISLWAKSNLYYDVSDADQLTCAEIEGRRQNRAMLRLLAKHDELGSRAVLLSQAATVAARQTRQIACLYRLTGEDLLYGKGFCDAIAGGAYPSDIHHEEGKMGATYRYLDGVEEYERYGYPVEKGRWLAEGTPYPKYWQIPFRSMIPASKRYGNLILCGRAIDTDPCAFGAIRVMINLNQTGEAAGVAAAMCADSGVSMAEIDPTALRGNLSAGGSIML